MIDLAEGTREVIEVSPEGAPEIIEVSSSRAGRAATVAIGVITTGAPGTSASVTNSGTVGEAVLDFTIPTGENVELRINGGYIQWKTTEAETWNNLIEIADITATMDIGTVTTGDADTDVSVINSGSGKDAVFNISIPKGTTFTPSVSAEGVISFTNDGGLANPSSVDITGPQGIQGDPAPNTIFQYSVNGTDWTTVATGAHWYRQSGDNGVTWSEAIKLAITDYVDGKISQIITEGVEDKAPSEAAVFDALALKAPLNSPTFTGDVIVPDQTAGNNSTKAANTKYVDAKVADAINDGVTGIAPSQNAVFDALALKIDSSDVAVTAGANKIPKADVNGDIDSGWIKDASATVKGVVELATDAEVIQGTDTERAVTPAGLTAWQKTPVGAVVTMATTVVPPHCLECNGAEISRETYSELFAVIGTVYGAGDGSTTFKIPDLRGEFIRGWDNARGIDASRAIGSAQADAFKLHEHRMDAIYPGSLGTSGYIPFAGTTGTMDAVWTNTTGGTETRPRNVAMMYCIVYE